jgi:nitrate/nitrite transporter NarK
MLTGLVLMHAGVNHPLSFFLPCVAIGMGNGLTLPPSNAGVLTIAGKNAGAALGLSSAITISGAAFLSFVSGFVIQEENARESTLVFMLVVASAALLVAVLIFRAMQLTHRPGDRPAA